MWLPTRTFMYGLRRNTFPGATTETKASMSAMVITDKLRSLS